MHISLPQSHGRLMYFDIASLNQGILQDASLFVKNCLASEANGATSCPSWYQEKTCHFTYLLSGRRYTTPRIAWAMKGLRTTNSNWGGANTNGTKGDGLWFKGVTDIDTVGWRTQGVWTLSGGDGHCLVSKWQTTVDTPCRSMQIPFHKSRVVWWPNWHPMEFRHRIPRCWRLVMGGPLRTTCVSYHMVCVCVCVCAILNSVIM